MLINASVDRWRRLRRRPELLVRSPAGGQVVADQAATVADRDELLRALATLPVRQRAEIVLRHLEDLPEPQTAAALGGSAGTVKSQTPRPLPRLRDLTAPSAQSQATRSTPEG